MAVSINCRCPHIKSTIAWGLYFGGLIFGNSHVFKSYDRSNQEAAAVKKGMVVGVFVFRFVKLLPKYGVSIMSV